MRIVPITAELLWTTPDALKVIEAAGRVCYKSEANITAESAGKFIRRLLKMGHESVIEHGVAAFRLVADRGVTHELVRHRLASYSQESTRYCNYASDRFGAEIAVVEPPGLSPEARVLWVEAMATAERAYAGLLAAGATPQTARAVLPTCLKTEIFMTANFREWRHFLKLRLAPAAHPQIRELAELVRAALAAAAPPVFEDLDKATG